MLCEFTRYSNSLYHPVEFSQGYLRTLATEPVRRAGDTHVVLWWYSELELYELTTDYGNIRFSKEIGDLYDRKGELGVDRIARISYRHGSSEATKRLASFLTQVQASIDKIKESEKVALEEITQESGHWLINMLLGAHLVHNRLLTTPEKPTTEQKDCALRVLQS